MLLTGAVDYILSSVSIYTVIDSELDMPNETYGMLYFAEVKEFGALPDFEMEKIVLFDQLPGNLTYPFIMPPLYKKVMEYISEN
jgi:8-oxo-dGTP diphosphatase